MPSDIPYSIVIESVVATHLVYPSWLSAGRVIVMWVRLLTTGYGREMIQHPHKRWDGIHKVIQWLQLVIS